MLYGDEAAREVELLHRSYLKIYELEAKNILFSKRWREEDGSFSFEDHRNAYLYDMVRDNHADIAQLVNDLELLINLYPAFVVLPLIRAFAALSVRVFKGISFMEGALLSIWKVMKRLERHTASNTQAENGWAVLHSSWLILLKAMEDNDFDMEPGYGGGSHPTQPF